MVCRQRPKFKGVGSPSKIWRGHGGHNSHAGIRAGIGEPNAQATALLGWGRIAQSHAEWKQAEDYYVQARPLFIQTENAAALLSLDSGLAQVQKVLDQQAQQAQAVANAQLAQNEGRFEDAEFQYRTALGLAHNLGDSSFVSTFAAALVATSAAWAHSLREQGDLTQANRAYREALGVAREFQDADAESGRKADLIALATDRAVSLRAGNKIAEAELAYRDALDVAQEFEDAEAVRSVRSALIEVQTSAPSNRI